MGAAHKERLHNRPKSKFLQKKLDFGFWIRKCWIWIWIWKVEARGCATRQFSDGGLGVRGLIPRSSTVLALLSIALWRAVPQRFFELGLAWPSQHMLLELGFGIVAEGVCDGL